MEKGVRGILQDLINSNGIDAIQTKEESIAQATQDILKLFISKLPSEEDLRLCLVMNMGWFIQEWEERPKSGKGSDRSDLVKKLSRSIHNLMMRRMK